MRNHSRRGFTLIELLTVIAIIAILAGITFAAIPRVRERAKIAAMNGTVHDINIGMAQYYTQYSTYPPGYGFELWKAAAAGYTVNDIGVRVSEDNFYYLMPYTVSLGIHGQADHMDPFSYGLTNPYHADQDPNRTLGLAEFLPAGTKDLSTNSYSFANVRFTGGNVPSELAAISQADRRPFFYVPVNKRQFEKARKYWIDKQDWWATTWNYAQTGVSKAAIPPARYDAYALISVGPAGKSFDVVPPDTDLMAGVDEKDIYYILALRAYFLATRDLNQNGLKDFDYNDRTTGREGQFYNIPVDPNKPNNVNPYYVTVNGVTYKVGNDLPDPKARYGYGPMIFVVDK